MATALEGVERSASRPGRSLPPGKTRYPLYRRLGGPQGRSGQVRKISPPLEFDPRTVQPVASRYTDYATRTTWSISTWKIAPEKYTAGNICCRQQFFNPLNSELNPICHLLAFLVAHHIFHVSGLRINLRSALFWDVMQRIAVIPCRFFRDALSVPSSRFKQSKFFSRNVGQELPLNAP